MSNYMSKIEIFIDKARDELEGLSEFNETSFFLTDECDEICEILIPFLEAYQEGYRMCKLKNGTIKRVAELEAIMQRIFNIKG